jgi:hypothetical protein
MVMPSRHSISRRTVLRGMLAGGVAVTVPLPRLVGMLNGNGTAYAQGAPLPVRFGTWFFGNGIIPDRWVPSSTGQGDAWQLSEQLAPLAEVKSSLSVLTGLSIKVPNNSPHASHPCAALTGAGTGPGQVQLPSIDQLIAPVIGGGTAFPTGIHAGLSNQTGATALGLAVSYRGPNAANPPTYSPTALYQQLLGFTSDGTPAAVDPELLYRQSVLDAVAEDANALKGRLGAEDQVRLDQHLDGVNELQGRITRLAAPISTGPVPNPDELYAARGEDGSISRERNQALADLLVFALATDLTRVFSYMFTSPASHGNYADCGLVNSSFHEDYGHRLSRSGLSAATRGFNTGVKYAMSNLADLLTKMKDVPEAGGTLLDNSCVYVTSCVSESQTHSGNDFPLLVAGKAGGSLRGDQHVRLLNENVSKVPFTLLTALGGTAQEFGQAEGRVTSGIAELLA